MWKIKTIPLWKRIAYVVVFIAAILSISQIDFTLRVNSPVISDSSENSSGAVADDIEVSDCSRLAQDEGQVKAYRCLKSLRQSDFLEQIASLYVIGYSRADIDFFEEQITECDRSNCSLAIKVYLSSVILQNRECELCENILFDALSSSDAQIRYFAAGRFAYINDPSYVGSLVKAFGTEDDPGTIIMLGLSISTLDPQRFETVLEDCAPWKAALFSSSQR